MVGRKTDTVIKIKRRDPLLSDPQWRRQHRHLLELARPGRQYDHRFAPLGDRRPHRRGSGFCSMMTECSRIWTELEHGAAAEPIEIALATAEPL